MIIPSLARRYARALSDVAAEQKAEEPVGRDLELLASACRESPKFASALVNPAIPAERKLALIEALARHGGGTIHKLARNLLAVLIRNKRVKLLEPIQQAFQSILDERMGIIAADVTSRFDLQESQQARLGQRLQEVTGKKVKLRFSKDESLLGGLVLRVGSTVYDGSVRKQLEEIRARLSR